MLCTFLRYPDLWDAEGNLAETLRIRYKTCIQPYNGGFNQITVRMNVPKDGHDEVPLSPALKTKPDDWFQIASGLVIDAYSARLSDIKGMLGDRAFRLKGAREIFSLDGEVKRSFPDWDTFVSMKLPEDIVS